MQAFLSLFVEQEGAKALIQFLVLTLALGGGAAFMAGRALATGWEPAWKLVLYMIPFTAGVRFLHYALFEGTLTSLYYFLVEGAVFLAIAALGYRMRRTQQMTSQYPWLYRKTGPLSWQSRN